MNLLSLNDIICHDNEPNLESLNLGYTDTFLIADVKWLGWQQVKYNNLPFSAIHFIDSKNRQWPRCWPCFHNKESNFGKLLRYLCSDINDHNSDDLKNEIINIITSVSSLLWTVIFHYNR